MTSAVPRILIAVVLPLLIAIGARADKPRPFVIVPSTGAGPFPVAVWLHGYRGYSPDGYFRGATTQAMQKHADAIGAVIIGFPATTELGDNTQSWSEEPVADDAYIQAKIREVGQNVKLDLSRVALFGFSQGALVAADVAARHPDRYRGALLMSIGCIDKPKPIATALPEHRKQVYFCFCGAEETPDNVALTRAYATYLEKGLGAKVTMKLYDGVSRHDRPPDFVEKFPEWISAILKRDENPDAPAAPAAAPGAHRGDPGEPGAGHGTGYIGKIASGVQFDEKVMGAVAFVFLIGLGILAGKLKARKKRSRQQNG